MKTRLDSRSRKSGSEPYLFQISFFFANKQQGYRTLDYDASDEEEEEVGEKNNSSLHQESHSVKLIRTVLLGLSFFLVVSLHLLNNNNWFLKQLLLSAVLNRFPPGPTIYEWQSVIDQKTERLRHLKEFRKSFAKLLNKDCLNKYLPTTIRYV